MPFLKGPEGTRETADGRKENGELLPGRVGARGLGQAAGLSCLPEPVSAGSSWGGSAAASALAAGWYLQPETCPPSPPPPQPALLPARLRAASSNRPSVDTPLFPKAGSGTKVRLVGVGHPRRVLLDRRFQLLSSGVAGAGGLAQRKSPQNPISLPGTWQAPNTFRLAAFAGRAPLNSDSILSASP